MLKKTVNILLVVELICLIFTFIFGTVESGCDAKTYDLFHPFGHYKTIVYNPNSPPIGCASIGIKPGFLPEYTVFLNADILIITVVFRIILFLF